MNTRNLGRLTDAISRLFSGDGERQTRAAEILQNLPPATPMQAYAEQMGIIEAQNIIDRAVETDLFFSMKRDEVLETARGLLADLYGDVEPLMVKKDNGKSALIVIRLDKSYRPPVPSPA